MSRLGDKHHGGHLFSLPAWVVENVRIADGKRQASSEKIAIWTGKWEKAKRTGSDEDKRGIQIEIIWWKWRVLDATHIWRGGKAGTVWKEKEGARRRKKIRRHIRCWGGGRGINALFELCKIAAWERRGVCLRVCVCLSIRVAVWQKRLREGESKGKSREWQHDQHVESGVKIGCNAAKNKNNEQI